MSKQIPFSCSAEDPVWQHSGDSAKDQLRPVSQTISTAGAVCMDQQPTLHSSAIAFAGEMPKWGGPRSLKYCTTQLPQLMGSIDLFDTMWIYEATSLEWEYQSVAQNKQTEIQLDTLVIPRWVCSLSEGATVKKRKRKHTVKFFFCYVSPAVTHSSKWQDEIDNALLNLTNWHVVLNKHETAKHTYTLPKRA